MKRQSISGLYCSTWKPLKEFTRPKMDLSMSCGWLWHEYFPSWLNSMQQFYNFERTFNGTWQKLQFSCKTLNFIVIDACRIAIHSCQHGISSRSIKGGKIYSNIYVILEITMMKLAKEGVSSTVASRIFCLRDILAKKILCCLKKFQGFLHVTFSLKSHSRNVSEKFYSFFFSLQIIFQNCFRRHCREILFSAVKTVYFFEKKRNSNANFRLAAEAKMKSFGYRKFDVHQ